MRVKFEAIDATGKVHKRRSMSHVYSHCVVIHFAAHPPSKVWPKGVAAYSHAEWVESCALAERKASRWRKEPCVEAIEIVEARRAHDPESLRHPTKNNAAAGRHHLLDLDHLRTDRACAGGRAASAVAVVAR
jgi:hypothetical protein